MFLRVTSATAEGLPLNILIFINEIVQFDQNLLPISAWASFVNGPQGPSSIAIALFAIHSAPVIYDYATSFR